MSAAPAADHVLRMLALLSHHPEPVSAGLVAATSVYRGPPRTGCFPCSSTTASSTTCPKSDGTD